MDRFINFVNKRKFKILFSLSVIFLFCFIFKDILFFGKTLRGEPYAGGVIPSGPAYYTGDRSGERFLADPGASSWNDNPPFVIAANQVKHGYFPWWNPFNATGTPIFADLLSGISFPLKWPLVLNSSPFMFDLFSLLRIFIGVSFLYLFLRRLKINRWIAIVSAFAFGTSGSIIRYANMEHLSIDALIPFYLFSVEYFFQEKTKKSWLLLSGSILLALLAAFPEANIFATTLTYTYFLFRTLQEKEKLFLIKRFIFANIIAILIASPLLISFIQLISQSWNAHTLERSLGLSSVPLSLLFSVVTPILYRPTFTTANETIQFGQLGWIGGILVTLAIMGIFTRRYKKSIGVFFGIYGLLALAKTFGFIGITFWGYLPGFSQAIFPKYNQPSITIAIIISAAIFIDYLYSKRVTLWQLGAGLISIFFIYGYYFFSNYKIWFDKLILVDNILLRVNYYKYLLAFLFFTFLILFVLFIILVSERLKAKKLFLPLLLTLISIELVLNFPKFFPDRDKGYSPVKFVTETKKSIGDSYRASAKDEVLYPQVSGVYGVRDIRQLDAIYLKNYMEFLRLVDPKIVDRFVTLDESWLMKPNVLRMLAVKNILAVEPIEEFGISDLSILNFTKESLSISGRTRSIFFLHPPITKEINLTVPNGTKTMYFYLVMDPKVWDPDKGDGVNLKLSTSQGVVKDISIDPKNNPKDRVWNKVEFPVQPGKVELKIALDGNKTINFDWTGISDFYSKEQVSNLNKFYSPTPNFPIAQDNYSILSYEVVGAHKMAYFPKQISFVSNSEFKEEVKNNLGKINELSIVESSSENKQITQQVSSQPFVKQKINGDTEITLEDNHPNYLFISQPFTTDTKIKNQDGRELKWYKANIAFVLIEVGSRDKKIFFSNQPHQQKKILFASLSLIGVALGFGFLINFQVLFNRLRVKR